MEKEPNSASVKEFPIPKSVTPFALEQILKHYRGETLLSTATVFDRDSERNRKLRNEVAVAIECLELDNLKGLK